MSPETSVKTNERRIARMIRTLGLLNVLLLLALIGSWAWFLHANSPKTIQARVEGADPTIDFRMPIRVVNQQGNTLDFEEEHVMSPIVTVYGKVEDYQALRDSLEGFSVLIRGTSVSLREPSGEFAEQIALQEGRNIIDIVAKWDGKEQYRWQYVLNHDPSPPKFFDETAEDLGF